MCAARLENDDVRRQFPLKLQYPQFSAWHSVPGSEAITLSAGEKVREMFDLVMFSGLAKLVKYLIF